MINARQTKMSSCVYSLTKELYLIKLLNDASVGGGNDRTHMAHTLIHTHTHTHTRVCLLCVSECVCVC